MSPYRYAALAALAFVYCTRTSIAAPVPAGDATDRAMARIARALPGADFRSQAYAHVRDEVRQHVEAIGPQGMPCGAGVIEVPGEEASARKENHCGYRVKMAELLTPPSQKTGLLEKQEWYYENGVQWEEPLAKDLEDAPEEWTFLEWGWAKDVVVNKQKCGDCWAQATVKALELLIAGRDDEMQSLSVQTHISSCSSHGSCGGGYMSAPDFLVKYGNPFEEQDPYQGKNSKCKFDMNNDPPFAYQIEAAPNVGSSHGYSRALKEKRGPKVEQIKAMMYKYASPAVVTIAAISSSGGIIDSCSSINSGGNHMQDIIGWYKHEDMEIADVWNSWGTSHGKEGRTQLRWECGDGKLNRGLGKQARVYVYKPPTCRNQPDAYTGNPGTVHAGKTVMLGRPATHGQRCKWTPATGLKNPDSCETEASPALTTEYHLTAETDCARRTAMVLVTPVTAKGEPVSLVRKRSGKKVHRILTYQGIVEAAAE